MTYVNKKIPYHPYIAQWIQHHEYDWVPNSYSVSALFDPPQKYFLKKRHWDEIEIDIADTSETGIGSMAHYDFQMNCNPPHSKSERRAGIYVGDTLVTGKPDKIMHLDQPRQEIWDLKSTTVWAYQNKKHHEAYRDQLSAYAYIVENGFWLEWWSDDPKQTPPKGVIPRPPFDDPYYTREQRAAQAVKHGGYYLGDMCDLLSHPYGIIVPVIKDFKKTNTIRKTGYPRSGLEDNIVIQLMPQEEIFSKLRNRVKLFLDCEFLSEAEMPECTPKELWQDDTVYKPIPYLKKKNKLGQRVLSKRAVKGAVFETEAEVYKWFEENHRSGVPRCYPTKAKRCMLYCDAHSVCPQYQRLLLDNMIEGAQILPVEVIDKE